MLHDVEFVVDHRALRRPLLDTGLERLPHIHAGGLDPQSLTDAQLATEKLVPPQLPQSRLSTGGTPALQIPQIDRSNRAFRQAKPFGDTSCGRTLASLPNGLLKPLTERRLAW